MNISTFASLTQLSVYTLRYYEKIGLVSGVHRNHSGHRSYSHSDVEWVKFINRLKATGMPLARILEYARLRSLGDGSVTDRHKILQQHRDTLKKRIENELEYLQALDVKIAYYAHKSLT